jgi:hypothetical protein
MEIKTQKNAWITEFKSIIQEIQEIQHSAADCWIHTSLKPSYHPNFGKKKDYQIIDFKKKMIVHYI